VFKEAILICAATVLAVRSSHAAENRDLLWRVAQVCLANYETTGAAFPCLDVNVKDGVAKGYAILRPPLGRRDTILTPTRRIIGIEDRSLVSADAPNYFEDAWNARPFLTDNSEKRPAREDIALVVNSRLTRSQDQLHIHLGCISDDVKRAFHTIEPRLSLAKWTRLSRAIHGLVYWARPIARETLADVNPFRLVVDGIPWARQDMASMTIIVAGTRSAQGRDGFLILVARTERPITDIQPTAEDTLDPSCP